MNLAGEHAPSESVPVFRDLSSEGTRFTDTCFESS